ncbi:hypothetical protein JOD43_000494 [Pullulanibacillus pueri]|uniref:Regulatory protein YrvL n=1 Tax=Pullulanibacillus pueri TaxID=1437324 RepID=A0A8J2ZSZ5_9BACL|nr:YrvL family regulatory protein [Pullulanibacillus pueri]MBM7680335.1 hypothetical protein [Pullulanibacillus pueri]GGH75589.1 hypothetical protein GCM10007096_04970 [Pullulanibacillus pueri]
MGQDYGKFANLRFRDKLVIIFGIGLIISSLLLLLFSGLFFGLMGFFTIASVPYASSSALLLFIVLCFSFIFISNLFIKRYIKPLFLKTKATNPIGRGTGILFYGLLMLLIVHDVDHFIAGLTLNWRIETLLTTMILIINSALKENRDLQKRE